MLQVVCAFIAMLEYVPDDYFEHDSQTSGWLLGLLYEQNVVPRHRLAQITVRTLRPGQAGPTGWATVKLVPIHCYNNNSSNTETAATSALVREPAKRSCKGYQRLKVCMPEK